MKIILLSFTLTFFLYYVSAQSLIDITVSSNTFSPANINIDVGDTVRWTNINGFHNVNGTMAAYPSNPESFGNTVGGPGWVLTHIFTIPGFYDFHCDPHLSNNMVGTITVSTPTSIGNSDTELEQINIYPNPTNNILNIEIYNALFEKYDNLNFVVYDNLGKEVFKIEDVIKNNTRINTNKFNAGVFI